MDVVMNNEPSVEEGTMSLAHNRLPQCSVLSLLLSSCCVYFYVIVIVSFTWTQRGLESCGKVILPLSSHDVH